MPANAGDKGGGHDEVESGRGRYLVNVSNFSPVKNQAALLEAFASLRTEGLELVLIGASYAGYANSQLVATHPELHPTALIVVDSFLDLPARYAALPSYHETKKEMDAV